VAARYLHLRRRSAVALGAATCMVGFLAIQGLTSPVRAATAPGPVQNLVAQITGDQATLSWQAPANSIVARYQITALLDGNQYGTRIVTPPATSITWSGIPLGHTLQFDVVAVGSDGANYVSGPSSTNVESAPVTGGNSYCTNVASDCVVIDTAVTQGAENHPGSGLLHATGNPGSYPSPSLVGLLHLSHWRVAAASTSASYAASEVPPNQLIEILSDAWQIEYPSLFGQAQDPWANWAKYVSFVQSTVQQALSQGIDPYWEIQNEPQSYAYSSLEPANRTRVEQQYAYAYNAIKAVDPNARIIGPSIQWQYENSKWLIDMKTFIPFAAQNNLQFTALTWHDNCCNVDGSTLPYDQSPEVIRDHAQEVEQLISESPGIGKPALYVDENISPSGQFSPGWQAGYLAEEDHAGVAMASRTCWPYPGDTSSQSIVADCFGPTLDTLFAKGTQTPLVSFWVLADYATMNGTKLWSASTDPALSELAVTDGAGTTSILLGRHQTCSGWTAGYGACPVTVPPPPIATTINLLVPSGATSATVQVQELPDTLNAMATAPASALQTVRVSGGVATLTLPAVADGEAYFITVSPNSASGQVPPSGNTTVQGAVVATQSATAPAATQHPLLPFLLGMLTRRSG
jgi:hypothetical protein